MMTSRFRRTVVAGAAALVAVFSPALAGSAEAATPPTGCQNGSVCFFDHPYFSGVQETFTCNQLAPKYAAPELRALRNAASSFYNGCEFNIGIYRDNGNNAPEEYICVHGHHRMSDFRVAQFRDLPPFDNRATNVGGAIGDLLCQLSNRNGGYRTY